MSAVITKGFAEFMATKPTDEAVIARLQTGQCTHAEVHAAVSARGLNGRFRGRDATPEEESRDKISMGLAADACDIARYFAVEAAASTPNLSIPAADLAKLKAIAADLGETKLLAKLEQPRARSIDDIVAAAIASARVTPAPAAAAPTPAPAVAAVVPAKPATNPRVAAVYARRDQLVANHLSAVNTARSRSGKPPLTDVPAALKDQFLDQALEEIQ